MGDIPVDQANSSGFASSCKVLVIAALLGEAKPIISKYRMRTRVACTRVCRGNFTTFSLIPMLIVYNADCVFVRNPFPVRILLLLVRLLA